MSENTRIYLVMGPAWDAPAKLETMTAELVMAPRLVRASSQAQAVRHAAGRMFEAHVASQDDIVDAIGRGVTVEVAGA